MSEPDPKQRASSRPPHGCGQDIVGSIEMRRFSSLGHSARRSALAGGSGSMPTSRSIASIASQSSTTVR